MHRLAKLLAIVAIVGVALLIALTLVVRSQVDPEKLKARIETEATRALGRTVKVGSVSASWGAAVSIADLTVMDLEGRAPQLTLASARVTIALSALARGEVRLDSVSLAGLSVKARRLADGTLDSADVLAKLGAGTAGAGQAGTGAPVVVSFSDASIALEDQSGALPGKVTWSGISGTIDSGDQIAVALTGALAVGDAALASRLIVKADYRLAAQEGTVAVTARELALDRLRALVPALARAIPQVAGQAELTATVTLAKSTPSLASLALGLKDATLAGAPLPAPVEGLTGEIAYTGSAVELSGLSLATMGTRLTIPKATIAVKPGALAAEKVDFVLGDMPVSCSVNVSGLPAAPQIAVRVSAPDADLAKLARDVTGRIRVDATIAGAPGQLSATGQVQLLAPVKVPLAAAGGAPLTIASGTFTLNGQDLTTADLAASAFGMTCRPRLSVISLMAAPQVALDTGAVQIDLAKIAGALPAEAAKQVTALAPQGQLKVALRATGPLTAPRLSGAIEPEGFSLQLPGTGRRVTLTRGRIDIAGSRATLAGLTLADEGLVVTVRGGIEDLVGTPRVSLEVNGSNLPLARITGMLPADARAQVEAYHVEGQVNVDALVAGTPGALRADAVVALKGVSAVAPVGERRVSVKINSGVIEVTPDALALRGLEGVAENVTFGVNGTIANHLTEPVFDVTALAKGLTVERLRGFVPETVLAEMNARRVQLAFDARASVKGTRKEPKLVARLLPTSGTVVLPVAGKSLVATLSAGGEVGMEGDTVVLTGLPVTVAQNTVKVSGTIKDPQGAGTLDLAIAGQGLNLAGLAPLMPEAARKALAQAGFKGGRGLSATVKGTVAAPRIDAQVDLAGGQFASLPGLGAGRIPSGSLKLAGGAVVLDKLVFEVGGVPIDVAGKVTVAGEPSLAITVRGDAIDLASLSASMPLPAGTSLEGTTKLDVKIDGSPSAPRINGRVGLAGVGIRIAALAVPLRGEAGELVLAGEDIVIQDAAFRAGASRITARGKVARFTSDAVCQGVEVSGPVELADVAARLGVTLAGKGTVTARASGPARDPQMDGTLTVPAATYTSTKGSSIPVKDLSADFARGPTQLKIGKLTGIVAGGQLTATGVVNNPATAPSAVFQMSLAGASLAQLVPPGENPMAGKLDVSFNGTGGSLATLSGNGQMKVDGLVVDLTDNKQLNSYRKQAAGSKMAVGLLAALAKGNKEGEKLARSADRRLEFYGPVLDEAAAKHEMGTVSAPIAATKGIVRMEPIQGKDVTGRLTVALATGQIVGRIDRLQLGRVGLQFDIAGTLSAPKPSLVREAITVDGNTYEQWKAAQNAAAEAPAEGPAAATDAAPAAEPPKKKKKLGDLLLDQLKGAGESPAEEAPAEDAEAPAEAPAEAAEEAPAPKKKKKVLNLLLENLR